jgi:hypothetical protein
MLVIAFTIVSAAALVGLVPQQSSAPPHRISQRHKFGVMG